jgi:hypothetical protein
MIDRYISAPPVDGMTRAWVEQQMLRCRVLGPKFPKKKKALRQLIVVVERWGVVVIIERGEQATGPPRGPRFESRRHQAALLPF